MIIFLWLVHYEIEQLDKGLLLLCNGVVFVLFTSTVAGLEGSNGALFAVPEQTRIALVALVMMAGSTFLGAGGSVIANVAADHSSDRTITKNETQSLVNVEAKLKAIYRLLWAIFYPHRSCINGTQYFGYLLLMWALSR